MTIEEREIVMEEWREYPYNPDYECSDMGNVRRKRDGKILKLYPQKSGYVVVWLGDVITPVHRIICETFHDGKRSDVVDHINTIRSDNRACNLRWATFKQNSNNETTKVNMSNAQKKRIRKDK